MFIEWQRLFCTNKMIIANQPCNDNEIVFDSVQMTLSVGFCWNFK